MSNKADINPPARDPVGSSIRGLAKAFLGALPAGPFLSEIYDAAVPNLEQEDRDRWQIEVTNLTNCLLRRVGPIQIPQASLAWDIAVLLWQCDSEGKGRVAMPDDKMTEHFSGLPALDVEEAIAQLCAAGWIIDFPDPNRPILEGGFSAKSLLFAFIDPIRTEFSPFDDAYQIAEFALLQGDSISTSEVSEYFLWPNRRLYPALWLLSEHVVSSSCECFNVADYPFANLYLDGTTRVKLRQFARA